MLGEGRFCEKGDETSGRAFKVELDVEPVVDPCFCGDEETPRESVISALVGGDSGHEDESFIPSSFNIPAASAASGEFAKSLRHISFTGPVKLVPSFWGICNLKFPGFVLSTEYGSMPVTEPRSSGDEEGAPQVAGVMALRELEEFGD